MPRIPIACSLTPTDLDGRLARWKRLPAQPTAIAGGVEVRVEDSAADELAALVAAERDCCAWARWDVEGTVLRATSDDATGAATLRSMFGVA